MAFILEILEVAKEDNNITIDAVVDEMVVYRNQTLYDPAEYAPAVCRTHIELDEDEIFPENEEEQIKYLQHLDPEWEVQDSDY